MSAISRERCRSLDAIARGNRRVFDYWQSLRTDSGLPSRSSFAPAQVKSALSRLLVAQVWPHEKVICRLSGTEIVRAVGYDLTGTDIVEQSPPSFRQERLARYSNCFEGFVHRSLRNMPNSYGEIIQSELLILPFSDIREDGSRLALLSVDWVSSDNDKLRSVADAFVIPEFAEYLAV
jgi:hypothetical protein